MAQILWRWGKSDDLVSNDPFDDVRTRKVKPQKHIFSRYAVQLQTAIADAMGLRSIGTAILLNDWIGRRMADVVHLQQAGIVDGELKLRQAKMGAEVDLPIGLVPQLIQRLDDDKRHWSGSKLRSTALIGGDPDPPLDRGPLSPRLHRRARQVD